MALFYDTHSHLDFPEFNSDLAAVIDRARAAGIGKIISIGTNLESSRRSIEIAESFPSVYAVVGWHPAEAAHAPADFKSSLIALARHPKVVGLGETGLDYHRLPSGSGGSADDDVVCKQAQARLFRVHLEAAADLGLNCVIHQRDALEDTLAQLEPFADRVRGVFHCFANDAAAMKRIVTLNSLVSFTGIATFKNGQMVRDTMAATPLNKMMLETDCPYLAPVPYRGKRCEPAYVKEIAEATAQVKGCSLEELSAATCATAHEFFRGLKEERVAT